MEQNAEQHAEQRAQHTEARAASSSQADASQVSMMMQMMSLMQEQNRQQAVLLDAVTRRLDALEASRGPPGGGMVPPPPPGISASMVQQGGCQASGGISFPADGKPPFGVNLPVADYKSWHSRLQELLGYRTWFESFLSWINLISERYAREIHEATTHTYPIKREMLDPDQQARGQRLLSFLRQSFAGYSKAEGIIAHYVATNREGEAHGFEAIRLINREFSIQSRAEALGFRSSLFSLAVKEERLLDAVRAVETQLHQFEVLLRSASGGGVTDGMALNEADKVLILMRNLPAEVRTHVQLHGRSSTFEELKNSVLTYDLNTRVLGDVHVQVNAFTKGSPKGDGKDKGKGREDKGKGKGKHEHDRGKGKGADKGKDKSSRGRSASADKELGKGVCYNCGKPGHKAKDCRSKPTKSPRASSEVGPCFECGQKGHLKKDCPKLRSLESSGNVDDDEQFDPSDPAVLMTLRVHVQSTEPPKVERVQNQHVSHVGEATSEALRMSESHGVDDLADQWLSDSGATAHIVSRKHLSSYRVLKEHPSLQCELKAANDGIIATYGIVDLEVRFFAQSPRGQKRVKSFVLTKCIIADIPFSVISPFSLKQHGWVTTLGDDRESKMSKGHISIKLEIRDRAWWAVAQLKRSTATTDVAPMDVSVAKAPACVDSGMNMNTPRSDPGCKAQHVNPKSILKTTTSVSSTLQGSVSGVSTPSSARSLSVSSDCSSRTSLCNSRHSEMVGTGLSFFLRALKTRLFPTEPEESESAQGMRESACDSCVTEREESESAQCMRDSSFASCVTAVALPLSSGSSDPAVPVSSDDDADIGGLDADSGEVDLGLEGDDLTAHLANGHFPFSSACRSCMRARGRIPARRLKHKRGAYEVAMDFGFLGLCRFLVLIVPLTGILGAFVMSSDEDANVRTLNNWFRECGLTGKELDCTLDGENKLKSLVQRAVRAENSPVTGAVFGKSPPGRHQGNGRAERAIETVKQGVGSNLLFLEDQIQTRVDYTSPLMSYLIPFVARMHNIHHVPQGSENTAVDRMKGRLDTPKVTTFPFGSLVYAKPGPSSVRSADAGLEKLAEVVYLGPVSCIGGGVLGIPGKSGRIGVEESLWSKVRTYQKAKAMKPFCWSLEELSPLLKRSVGGHVPSPVPVTQDPSPPTYSPEIPQNSHDESDEVVIPVSGPPIAWIKKEGPTEGCNACNQYRREGKIHGKVHSKACKQRYKEFLEDERRKKCKLEASPTPPVPVSMDVDAPPRTLPPVPAFVPVPSGSPQSFSPGSVPVSQSPDPASSSAAVPIPESGDARDADSLGGGIEDMAVEPTGDAMEVDLLIEYTTAEMADRLLSFEQSTKGGPWFKDTVCGTVVWQQMPLKPHCESTAVDLSHEQVEAAMRKEFSQCTKLAVGRPITEREAHEIASDSCTKILPTRWVLVMKHDGRIRARVVVKDLKSAGLPAVREGHYSPTSSLESLRLVLAVSARLGLSLVTIDISTAFLYASLSGERQVVKLPSSCKDARGNPVFLDLLKALYGLRRAPVYWYRELKRALLKLGFEITADPAVFRHYSSEFGLVLVVVYVDDCLFAGAHESCLHFVAALASGYEVKPTGELKHGVVGCVEFLGKEVKREEPGGPLLIGLPSSYWDGIESASGLTLKPQDNPPDLSKFVECETAELEKPAAERYRTVLGKLAWYSLTLPPLQYYVSWLSCYQQSPTEASWTAMRLVLRYAKRFQGVFQAITSGTCWEGDEREVHGVTDASWSVRSVAGGVVMWRDTMIKSWSRRIGTPCLSSAEAELFGIVECLKECLHVAMCLQTFLEGLPSMDRWSHPGIMPLVVWTDSESAKNISMMQGLLRRVRHLELRVMLVQYHTDAGRLVVRYVPGGSNPTDSLTKPSDVKHADMLSEIAGLRMSAVMKSVLDTTAQIVDGFETMSTQNRRRVTEGLRRALAGLSFAVGAWRLSSHLAFLVPDPVRSDREHARDAAPTATQRKVRFAPGV